MPQASTNTEIADLVLQLRELQQRVARIETRLGAVPVSKPVPVQPPPAPIVSTLDLPPNAVTVVGRLFLAIAGGYVLRSLTDWNVLPHLAGVAIGLVYALVWLWFASRGPANSDFAAAISASTSMLIMGPLLWEGSQRLKVLSTSASATILAIFAFAALALSYKPGRRIIGTVAGMSCVVIAAALLLASDDIVPFTAALLAVSAAMELAVFVGPPSGARVLAGLASAACVLLFSYLMAGPSGMPETWAAASRGSLLSAQLSLAIIYASSSLVQALLRRKNLAYSEIVQTSLAILIGIGGALRVFEHDRTVMLSLGVGSLAAGLALYVVSFLQFERHSKRNFRALSGFGLVLVVAGIFLPFPRAEFWIFACICAIACYWAARSFALPTLGLHGAFYLTLACIVAGASGSVAILAAGAACWTAVTGMSAKAPGYRRYQLAALFAAGLAVEAMLMLAHGWIAARSIPVDTVETAVLTGLSLALAWASVRYGKPELGWIVYGLMALGAYKLATRDFVDEHNLALVVSLLCYGGALILLPRLKNWDGRDVPRR